MKVSIAFAAALASIMTSSVLASPSPLQLSVRAYTAGPAPDHGHGGPDYQVTGRGHDHEESQHGGSYGSGHHIGYDQADDYDTRHAGRVSGYYASGPRQGEKWGNYVPVSPGHQAPHHSEHGSGYNGNGGEHGPRRQGNSYQAHGPEHMPEGPGHGGARGHEIPEHGHHGTY
ncbi:hypothetical protein IWQ60_007243 [Tieghemiomyces parasiticus]|uniref:Uncharacterized protein n=1 Tax=Tieghemiomyces parasiticus TaxID=78921 RepID=A0A9W7ZZL5_9FUNG|nr:hypothetical protein IWQ60_007243 [Tieghemiomyces parasiticus]